MPEQTNTTPEWTGEGQLAALVAASGHTEQDAAMILRKLYLAGWIISPMVLTEIIPDDDD